jgi:hypothetical protein
MARPDGEDSGHNHPDRVGALKESNDRSSTHEGY